MDGGGLPNAIRSLNISDGNTNKKYSKILVYVESWFSISFFSCRCFFIYKGEMFYNPCIPFRRLGGGRARPNNEILRQVFRAAANVY
jgi:hypothetical protein